ncbi:DUF4873 domain-containing protein [Blastococcus sp. CT_GayMR16]|uniref:DUF4873 domain-containing protein n=1 Tax=Blastococcus sp. CT_GayMR16 TaxID=2559607 RepID=UPI0010730C0B|nr:DUF4873 domain-containing protein [Blastococcus sp. CT_GayMR16]TFV86107.1 DUF4873 domain-containing protein [Blastococcus sp. CT_GayMR16]
MSDHDAPEGYEGEVTVAVDGAPPRTARAALAARFDPLAGHVVWTGRVDAQLAPRTSVQITTPHGTARADATETDPWGNTRLAGTGRPPFPVELLDGGAAG